MRFLHTADWQIGKPFESIEDPAKREALRRQRLDTVAALGELVREHGLAFVLVCGDLFDSFTPDKSTVSAFCSAVGKLKVPVYAIPGNHDHGGPGCIWEQPFFQEEASKYAPNLSVLLKPEPLVTEHAVLFPCPLLRRHESIDTTAWLGEAKVDAQHDALPRIVLAHGSTQGFSSSGDGDQDAAINQINLERLSPDRFNYVALGDWHGFKQVAKNAYYSGTPEIDRFPRGAQNEPGHVAIVEIAERDAAAGVRQMPTGLVGWHELPPFALHSREDLELLEVEIDRRVEGRNQQDLLKLQLHGTLSFELEEALEKLIEKLEARLIRLKLERDIFTAPSDEELQGLRNRPDPLIAKVAAELIDNADPSAPALLRELHMAISRQNG